MSTNFLAISLLNNLAFLARGKYKLPYQWLLHYLKGSGEDLEIPDECLEELEIAVKKSFSLSFYGKAENAWGDQATLDMIGLTEPKSLEIGTVFQGGVSFFPYNEHASTQIESMCKTALMIGSFGCKILDIVDLPHQEKLIKIKVWDVYDWHPYKTEIPKKYLKYLLPINKIFKFIEEDDEGDYYLEESLLSKIGKPFLSYKVIDIIVYY